tara:strand:+ start:593 stop:784 length:192 start_codon:yes stop_codon:yes gene_type:complete
MHQQDLVEQEQVLAQILEVVGLQVLAVVDLVDPVVVVLAVLVLMLKVVALEHRVESECSCIPT